jgi:hypothetical protein
MSWRRGELWLDTDLLWFREAAGAPAFAGLAPPALPTFPSPPGLAASRQRRAARRRRKNERRVRAAALALSPVVVIPVASHRGSGGTKVLAEDPPSLTFRLSSGTVEAAERVLRAEPSTPQTSIPIGEPAEVFPTIEWHHATSVGLPYEGRLIDGTQLPVEGPNWVTWNPVSDSVPNAPHRLYGNEHTIRTILSVIDDYRAAHPDAPRVVVGDISFEGGGPMDEHVSHQNGLDVDVYYPRLDGALRAPAATDQVDVRLAQALLDRFVAAGAQMIFVGYSTGLRGASGVVIPYPNHEYHMHVRFPPP